MRTDIRCVMVVVLAALAGCRSDADGQPPVTDRPIDMTAASLPSPTTAPTAEPTRSSPVITMPPSDMIEEAVIAGAFTMSDGCLYVDASEGGPGVVVFSHGTTWDPATSSVVNPDGTSLAVGERLEASGGGHPLAEPSGSLLPDDAIREVQRCADSANVDGYYVVGRVAAGAP